MFFENTSWGQTQGQLHFAKAANYTCKMILKLTAVVDFMNTLHALLITNSQKANVF